MNARLESRLKRIEEKIKPKPRIYTIVSYEGKEEEAEEKKREILEKDPNATLLVLHIIWAK